MKFKEKQIIEIQKLTKLIAEQAKHEDSNAVKISINRLSDFVYEATFNDWCNRMLQNYTGNLRNPNE